MHETPIKMVITDLDGTLLNSRRQISSDNLDALSALGHRGVQRVIATGRSLYSFRKVVPSDAPIDYLIFSSGAGLMHWPGQTLLESHSLTTEQVQNIHQRLTTAAIPHMIQAPVPENHRFYYWDRGTTPEDYQNRLSLYAQWATALEGNLSESTKASQFVAIFKPGDTSWQTLLQAFDDDITVIRATSPLDHKSTWIEIFPGQVSKSQCAQRLCKRLNIDPENTMAVGNDYNDADLLAWARHAAVVANAPEDLKNRHIVVGHHDDHGFAQAVAALLS